MRACRPHRFALAAATAAAVLLIGLAVAPGARAQDTEDTEDIVDAGDAALAAATGTRFSAMQPRGQAYAASDVQWRRRDDASSWFARVSLGESLPQRALNGEVQWLFRGWAGHALTLGALGQHYLQALVAPAGSPPAPVDLRLAAYVRDEWQVGPGWRLVFGLRADRSPGGEQALAPRAALLWQALPALQVKLLDGVAYREPNASLSPLRELVPQIDPSLANERLRATELALDWRAAAKLRLAASLYRNDAGQASDAVVTGLAQGSLRFQNLGRANGDGVELGSEYAADAGWQVRATWSASRARDGGDAVAVDAPRTLAKLQATTPLAMRGARAGLEWWRVGAHGGALDAQYLLNATLDWTPTGMPWTLAASAYNLTGRTMADGGSGDALQAALWRDGRRLQLQLARAF